MVNKYVVIELVIQYRFLCCLPYDIVIYEGQALTIQRVITFIPDTYFLVYFISKTVLQVDVLENYFYCLELCFLKSLNIYMLMHTNKLNWMHISYTALPFLIENVRIFNYELMFHSFLKQKIRPQNAFIILQKLNIYIYTNTVLSFIA